MRESQLRWVFCRKGSFTTDFDMKFISLLQCCEPAGEARWCPLGHMGPAVVCSPPQSYHPTGPICPEGLRHPLHCSKKIIMLQGTLGPPFPRAMWVARSKVSLTLMQSLTWVTWSGSGQISPIPTAGYIKILVSKPVFLTIFSASFPSAGQPPASQSTYRSQMQRLGGATRPSQGSQELQLSLGSGGKGWSYCIRNSAAAQATEILTCCINLCASWMNYILLLSAICFSDLTLAVSVLLLKCTLHSRKYFLFWFLSSGLQKLREIRQQQKLWPRPPAVAQQQKNRCSWLLLLREAHTLKPLPAQSLCCKGARIRAWPTWRREWDLSPWDFDKTISITLGVAPLHPLSEQIHPSASSSRAGGSTSARTCVPRHGWTWDVLQCLGPGVCPCYALT